MPKKHMAVCKSCLLGKAALYERLFLLHALQKTPDLSGAECQGVGTTPFHADERGQTARFVAVIEPPVYWGISIGVQQKNRP